MNFITTILTVLFFHGIPISLGILGVYWVVIRIGREQLAITLRTFLFSALGLYIVAASIYWWYSAHHTNKFVLNDTYEVYLTSHEVDSFLDWPIEFEIEIKEAQTGITKKFEFYGEGPYIQFLISEKDKSKILIKGYDYSQGFSWLIDFEQGTIEDIHSYNAVDTEGFHLKAKLTSDFEIIKNEQSLTTE